jgi:ketosteroid isomerase-like protein
MAQVRSRPSASNLALAEATLDAYNRRDVERLSELMTEDVDLRPPIFQLLGRAYRGHGGIAEWMGDLDESFATVRIESQELRDAGDAVLVLGRFEVEGQASHMELGSELGLVLGVSGGRVASWVGFFSHSAAVQAVSEDGAA